MLSVRAIIYDGKQLKLLKKVDIKKPQQVIVVFLDYPENGDEEEQPLSAQDLHALMAGNPALEFLAAEEEDIYSDEDLKVKY